MHITVDSRYYVTSTHLFVMTDRKTRRTRHSSTVSSRDSHLSTHLMIPCWAKAPTKCFWLVLNDVMHTCVSRVACHVLELLFRGLLTSHRLSWKRWRSRGFRHETRDHHEKSDFPWGKPPWRHAFKCVACVVLECHCMPRHLVCLQPFCAVVFFSVILFMERSFYFNLLQT